MTTDHFCFYLGRYESVLMPQMQVLCLLLNRDKVDLDSMPQFSAVSQLDSSFTVYQNVPVALSSLKKECCLMVAQHVIMQIKDHICALWEMLRNKR